MLQAKAIIKPLMGLTIAATVLTIGAFITMISGGYIGNGSIGTTSLCNYYLILKYNSFANQIYLSSFVMTILSIISSLMQCAFLICFFIKCREIEQNNSSQAFNLSPLQINRHYIFCSISIIGLIATVGSYTGLFFEKGRCLNLYYLNLMTIMLLSFVALLLLLICLVTVIRYAVQRPSLEREVEGNNKKINAHQIGGRQEDRNNVFQMEGGSEMYRTFKRQNQQNLQSSDKNQPLLYQNSPIPIHNGDTTLYKAQIGEPSHYNESITAYKKRSTSPERLQLQSKKQKNHEMIQKKKKKFREINPFKKQLNPNDKTLDDDDLLDERPKINGIQKTNKQLLRESKRPLRKAPHISSLYAAIEEAKRKAQYQQLGDVQRRNKLNKIKHQREQQLVAQSEQQPDQQEQPNENVVKNLSIKQNNQNLNRNEEYEQEIFYHRPRIEGVIDRSRKKKQLFEEEVDQLNPALFLDDDNNEEDRIVVINKLQQNKILRKSQMNKAPIVANKQNNHKLAKVVKPKTKEQLQLQFLKSKYKQQQDQPEQPPWIITEQQAQEQDLNI